MVVGVDYQYVGVYVVDDQFVDLKQVGYFVVVLVGQLLVVVCVVVDLVIDEGQCQVVGGEYCQFGQGVGGVVIFQQFLGVFYVGGEVGGQCQVQFQVEWQQGGGGGDVEQQ